MWINYRMVGTWDNLFFFFNCNFVNAKLYSTKIYTEAASAPREVKASTKK